MTPFLTKVRQFTGWALIIVSTVLMFVSIFVATTGEKFLKGGGIYVASQLTWYWSCIIGPRNYPKKQRPME